MKPQKKENIPQEQVENTGEEFISEITDETIKSDNNIDGEFENLFSSWIEENKAEDQKATVSLYKFDDFKSGNDKSFVWEWENDIPSKHSIGLRWGGGRYLLLVTIPTNKKTGKPLIKGKRFKLNPYYDELRKKEQENNQQGLNVPTIINPVNSLQDTFSIVKQVVDLLTPLIKQNQQPLNNAPPLTDLTPFLMQNYKMVQGVLTRSLIDQQRALKEMQDFYEGENNNGAEEMETTTTGNIVTDTLLPLVEKYLPAILGNTPQANILIGILKGLPQFKQIVENKTELCDWIKALDEEIGKNKTDKLLKKLNLSRVE